ncbi:MAG: hypothetical protein J5675_00680 [Bacteroidales bacterium]|nr:hypothetical protein [Bacteroidales bacterium]
MATLHRGETIPFSRIPEDWAEELLAEGCLSSIVHGSRKSLKVSSLRAYDIFLRSKGLQPDQLQETVEVLAERTTRAAQVQLLGDSKAVAVRSCPGFPVNVITPLSVRLGARKLLLCPCPGSFLYISDFLDLRIPSDTIVVGVENMENFRLPERQTEVWEQIRDQYGDGGVPPILLVSRYPQSKDLVTWLQSVHNPYVHFGDFDLAGIHIYLTEFYRHLGNRASFFIPDDIEARLTCSGSRERYDTQFQRFGKMEVTDTRVLPLVQLIHRYQRGYDQEGYIE